MPFPIVSDLIRYGIGALIIAMWIRIIASWIGIDERFAIIRFMARITDPFIEPIRRILRPAGVFDISFIVAWFLFNTVEILLLQSLPLNW